MRVKKGFDLMSVCDQNIIIAHGKENVDFSKVITLNESSALIWNALCDKEFSAEDAAKVLTDEYDVDEVTALADAKSLIEKWVEAGIVE